ncbi:MAG TPA: diguanylate cyclase [Candidatus Hydrogenedentes bacterium]|nr:diguanylate cyclase [Candidatus Hydrogenedentota bacterium]HPG67677.1 diguanylate cyclase [Candidatus Hydrogenedentota bacterium]
MTTWQGYKILIVEDNADLLKALEQHLSRAGHRVERAANGWEALKSLKADSTDLVIAELDLAETDGSSMREKSLLDPGLRDVPFLYLTREGIREWQIRGLRSGVDGHVQKPFDPVMVVARAEATIERRRIYEEMVQVDNLTRLLNRRTLEKQIVGELERVRRYDRVASLVLIDLDSFCKVNEEQGQAMGDFLLTCLAGIITDIRRRIDVAGRYRSDQFLLFLPETQGDGAQVLAERILERFREAADYMTGLDITFSAGIVETPRDGADFRALMTQVTATLAAVKQHGKGRVVQHSAEPAAETGGTPAAAG